MAETKDAFVCYRSYIEAINLLPENKRWSFFEKIIGYALDDIEPRLTDNDSKLAFTLMKANLDSCNKRYKSSVENGKKGGNPNFQKGTPNPYHKKLCKSIDNPNDNVNVNETLLSESEGEGENAPPPPANKQFLMGGEWYEYFMPEDGDREMVRKIDRPPQ